METVVERLSGAAKAVDAAGGLREESPRRLTIH